MGAARFLERVGSDLGGFICCYIGIYEIIPSYFGSRIHVIGINGFSVISRLKKRGWGKLRNFQVEGQGECSEGNLCNIFLGIFL